MELTPEKYAELLIEQHCSIIPIDASFNDTVESASRKMIADHKASVNGAIQDTKNTIKALNEAHDDLEDVHMSIIRRIDYHEDVLKILNDKL